MGFNDGQEVTLHTDVTQGLTERRAIVLCTLRHGRCVDVTVETMHGRIVTTGEDMICSGWIAGRMFQP